MKYYFLPINSQIKLVDPVCEAEDRAEASGKFSARLEISGVRWPLAKIIKNVLDEAEIDELQDAIYQDAIEGMS